MRWSRAELPSWDERTDLVDILAAVGMVFPDGEIRSDASLPLPLASTLAIHDAMDFARETYGRAVELGHILDALEPPEGDDRVADVELCENYQTGRSAHLFATACISAIDEGRVVPSHRVVRGALALLRRGAIDAYVAARRALELRQPPQDALDVDAAARTDPFGRDHAEDDERMVRVARNRTR